MLFVVSDIMMNIVVLNILHAFALCLSHWGCLGHYGIMHMGATIYSVASEFVRHQVVPSIVKKDVYNGSR